MPDYSVGSSSIKISPSFTNFVRDAKAELKAMDLTADAELNVQTSDASLVLERWRAEQEARDVKLKAAIDESTTSRARNDWAKLRGDLQAAGSVNLKVGALVGAAGLISELAAITESALEAGRAVALITPAAGFAGLASIGSVAAGIHGIPDAFKAINKASDDTTGSVTKQRDALDAVSNAEYSVTQANSKLSDAYRDASRQIRDMNDQLVDQKLAAEDASLSVQDAAANLQKVNADPLSTQTDRRRALIEWQQSAQGAKEANEKLTDQATDTAEANRKGVAGSDQVVQALHAQTVANQELVKAQAAAASGGGGGSKVNDALNKLSPNAKELVADIRSIGPAWHDAQQSAQDALTAGLGPAIKDLAAVQLPGIKTGMIDINTAINSGLKGSLSVLSSDLGKADVHEAMENTATALKNAAGAAAPLTDALVRLVKVGSEGLPGIGTAIDNAGHHFDDFVRKAEADGSLKAWIDKGETAAKELGQIVEHVTSAIGSVFKAAGDDGGTLKKLDDLTAKMSAFLKSADGQDKLREFFTTARGDIEHLEPILQDLPKLLEGVYGGFRTWSDIALPFLKTAGDLLSAHPGLVRDVVTAYLALKTLSPIIDGIQVGWRNANKAVGEFKTGLSGAKTTTEEAGTAAEEAAGTKGGKKGVGSLLGALGGVIGVTAAGGPLGIALGAATLGLGYLQTAHQNAADAAQHQKDQLEALNKTLDKTTGKATDATIEQTAQDLQGGGYLDRAKSFGIDPHTFTLATAGVADADKDQINQHLTKAITDSLGKDKAYQALTKNRFSKAGLSDNDIAEALQGIPDAVDKFTSITTKYNSDKQNDQKLPDLHALKDELDDVGESAATLGGQMNATDDSLGTGSKNARDLQEAIHGSFDLTDQATKNFRDWGVAVEDVPDSKTVTIKDTTPEVQQHLKDAGWTIEHMPDGELKLTADTGPALDAIKAVTNKPYTANLQLHLSPQDIILDREARQALHPGSGDLVTITGGHVGGRATGGPINGPGTGTSDSIIMRLSNGEYVINAAAANKVGTGVLDQINAGRVPVAQSIAAPASPAASPTAPADNPATPQTVTYPQAELPKPMSDKDIQKLQDQAAVDQANSERNQVYADPKSSAADKRAEDLKYLKTQNALTQDGKKSKDSGDASVLSAQGAGQALGIGLGSVLGAAIGAGVTSGQGADANATFGAAVGSTAGGELGQALGQGVLDFFGLGNSALSSSNPWNEALQKGVSSYQSLQDDGNGGIPSAYTYKPQNLPSVVTPTVPDDTSSPATGAGDTGNSSPTAGSATGLRGLAAQILVKEGFAANETNLNAMLAQIQSESGGNPTAENDWDSNAAAGNPSIGLLQTTGTTFEAYRDPGLPDDITDPAANMAAALRYYRATYGDDLTQQWGHGHGYADGGLVTGPGGPKSDAIKALLSGGEYVVNAHAAQRNLPALEAINSSSWNPVSIPAAMATAAAPAQTGPTHDHSIHLHQVSTLNVSNLMDEINRLQERQSIGIMAAWPV